MNQEVVYDYYDEFTPLDEGNYKYSDVLKLS